MGTAPEPSTDILRFLETAPAKVCRATFESEGESFDLELRLFSRADLERIRKRASKRVFSRETRTFSEEIDERKFRDYMGEHAILSWQGLTGQKLAQFARRDARVAVNGDSEALTREIPFSREAVRFLFDHAVWVREGLPALGFVDWLWEQVMGQAEALAEVEQDEKKT